MKNKNELSNKDYITQIENEKEKIYEYINTTRYQNELIQDLDIWNQICSSLYVIGDTQLSIEDYINADFPKSDGLKYIYTYGILQSIFIQQDAVRNLANAFNIPIELGDQLRNIRMIRNSAIGHPSKQKVKGKKYYNYISRISLRKEGFTLQKSNIEQRNDIFSDINLMDILNQQLIKVYHLLEKISSSLRDIDEKHKKNYKDIQMASILSTALNYSFEKVGEAIYSPGFGKRKFGLSMLNVIKKTYQEFEDELIKRKELPANKYLQYDLDQFKHAISKIQNYLNGKNDMQEIDARIYLYYIREENKSFLEIANEYDEEYSN